MFKILNVSSTSSSGDVTRKAAIRNVALGLFAEHGHASVTVRQIAEMSDVSPALVIHHFGSKDGLVEAVNAFVADALEGMLDQLRTGDGAPDISELEAGSLGELFAAALPPDSPVPAYLRRLLVEQDDAARDLVTGWCSATGELLTAMVAGGTARPSADAAVRAAFLVVNDLAMIVLRDVVTDLIGDDPLSPSGIRRWTAEALDVYTHGIFLIPADDPGQEAT